MTRFRRIFRLFRAIANVALFKLNVSFQTWVVSHETYANYSYVTYRRKVRNAVTRFLRFIRRFRIFPKRRGGKHNLYEGSCNLMNKSAELYTTPTQLQARLARLRCPCACTVRPAPPTHTFSPPPPPLPPLLFPPSLPSAHLCLVADPLPLATKVLCSFGSGSLGGHPGLGGGAWRRGGHHSGAWRRGGHRSNVRLKGSVTSCVLCVQLK